MSRRDGGLDAALDRQRDRMLATLVPAATAAAGKHIPRSTSALRLTVSAMHLSRSPAISANSEPMSIVNALIDVFRTLLLTSIQFTLVAGSGDDVSVRIYPFGLGMCGIFFAFFVFFANTTTPSASAQFNVPGTLLTGDERALIQYLGMAATEWVDSSQCTHFDGETLVASHVGNDAFEVALDRVRLVDAMRETLLYGGGEHVIVRHVVEAALLATASDSRVSQAGYFDALMHMAWHTRLAPLPSPSVHNYPLALAMARERWARLRIRTIDFQQYIQLLHRQYTNDPAAIKQARRAAFGSRR